MSGYDGVVGGKLKLKGKALDIKAGGVKKKKKNKRQQELITQVTDNELSADADAEAGESGNADDHEDVNDRSSAERKGSAANDDDNNLTPAEKRYIEQRAQIDVKRMAREANKSHRDRIQDFNQYLANMSEHYDIPKVGPG